MINNSFNYRSRVFYTVFDEASDAAAAAAAKAAEDAKAADTITKEQYEEVVAEAAKQTEAAKNALTELEGLREKSKLTTEERNNLDTRIETLNSTIKTQDELAKDKLATATREAADEKAKLTGAATTWQNRYEASLKASAIAEAAVKHDAVSVSQLTAILQPMTRVDEILDDDGKGTGMFAVKVKVPHVNDKKEDVVLDLNVGDAVDHLKKQKEFFNQFKATLNGGLGAENTGAETPEDLATIARDPVKYRAYKKAQEEKGK